jgi:hypothetical protein
MADISIQFYATPDELECFVKHWIKSYDIHVTAMRYRPFSIRMVQLKEIGDAVRDQSIRRLVFTKRVPDLGEPTKSDFDKSNPSALILDIGKLADGGLAESCLMCRTLEKDALKTWQEIAKSLKQNTQAGITATNRQNGATVYYSSSRFTVGAARLESEGTAMRAVQGKNGPTISLGTKAASENSTKQQH